MGLFKRFVERIAVPLAQALPGDGDRSAHRFAGTNGRGVLCLHGFTGTPFEVRPLSEGLARQGYAVAAPLLAGHGGSVDDLARTRWPDWLASAEQALDRLLDEVGRPVAVAGFSMGALLALRLARLRPGAVGALALMATPLRLRRFEALAVRTLSRLPTVLRRGPLAAIPKTRGYDVTDANMKLKNPGLGALPVDGVKSLLDLGELIRQDLFAIQTPTLIVHGALDRTVPLDDSLELAGCLGSQRIERLWLPRSGHLLALDVERAALIDAADRFFASVLPVAAGGTT